MTRLSRRAAVQQVALAGVGLEFDPLPPGSHTIASRATDRGGRGQPADLSLKKSNWENNAIWVRKIRV